MKKVKVTLTKEELETLIKWTDYNIMTTTFALQEASTLEAALSIQRCLFQLEDSYKALTAKSKKHRKERSIWKNY